MKEKIVSAMYVLYGLMDIAVSALSSSIPVHMVVLGMICLAAGAGLWMKKAWSIYLIGFVGSITVAVGLATLYSSVGFVGFGSTTPILLFDLSLVCYSVGAFGLFIYTIANRSKILEP